MPEAIPLRTNLSIETQDVVINHAFRITSLSDLVLQRLSPIARIERPIERPVKGYPNAGDDFFGSSCDHRWR